MKEVTVTMKFVVEDDSVEDLKKALSHHSEWLIDFESWKGIHEYSTLKIDEKEIINK